MALIIVFRKIIAAKRDYKKKRSEGKDRKGGAEKTAIGEQDTQETRGCSEAADQMIHDKWAQCTDLWGRCYDNGEERWGTEGEMTKWDRSEQKERKESVIVTKNTGR